MNNFMTRICPYCNTANPVEESRCRHCNADLEANLPAVRTHALPSLVAGVALPIVARATVPLLRGVYHLLRRALRPPRAVDVGASVQSEDRADLEPVETRRPRAVIHMRESWVIRNADGTQQTGQREATWEIRE